MKAPDDVTLPPHDIQAEKSTIGALLNDPTEFYRVDGILEPAHFFDGSCAGVYAAMRDLYRSGAGVDLVTVANVINQHQHAETLIPVIYECMNVVPTSLHLDHYAAIVEAMATRRRMIATASAIASQAYDTGGALDDQIAGAESLVMNLRGARASVNLSKPRDYAAEYLARIDKLLAGDEGLLGLSSPWTDLNRILGGFGNGLVYYLGGRPGMGKSAVAIVLASHWALKENKRVLFWSGEMSTTLITDRVIAARTKIPAKSLRRGTLTPAQHAQVMQAAGELSESHLIIDTTAGIRASQLRAVANRLKLEGGLDAIVIDYIGLMRPERDLKNTNAELTETSQALVTLARSLDVPVIGVAQLSRAVEMRADKRPQLSDLRDSGSLEQDAFAVIFAYRDDYYNDISERPNQIDLSIPKHRQGETGTVSLYWHGETFRVSNLAREVVLQNGRLT